jgi:hypothetical protein
MAMLGGLDTWERWSYRADVTRVVPRLVLLFYLACAGYVAAWFMGLKDASGPQAAFVSTVWGVLPLLLNFYASNGIDWERRITQRWEQHKGSDHV